jgi:L-iditol 2-dehydrogenase
MRAVVYRAPSNLPLEERPVPELEPGDVLVDVFAAGVCGTDVRIYKGEHRAALPERTPGHEIVGRIVGSHGPLRADLQLGDVVLVAPNFGCGQCHWCGLGHENLCESAQALGITIDGGFAESVRIPSRAVESGNLIPLAGAGAKAEDWVHAVLAEPLACVVRGQRRAEVRPGDSVFVGGGGPVGLLHVALARAYGATVVICSDPNPVRRDAAVRAGATHVIDTRSEPVGKRIMGITADRGVDVFITAAPSHELQAQSLKFAAVGGRVLLFGGLPKSRPTVELDTNLIHYKELSVHGTTACMVEDCRQAIELIKSGRVDTTWMVSHQYSLKDFDQAIQGVLDSTALKVALVTLDGHTSHETTTEATA